MTTSADLEAVAWEQMLADADAHELAGTIAAEMPVDVASAPVARLLADRHLALAVAFDALAQSLEPR